jgi:hypothetical protein
VKLPNFHPFANAYKHMPHYIGRALHCGARDDGGFEKYIP